MSKIIKEYMFGSIIAEKVRVDKQKAGLRFGLWRNQETKLERIETACMIFLFHAHTFGKENNRRYVMAVDFKTSETKDNLMRAFAGESQARNRYTFAADQAKQQKFHVIEAVFTFTANQEKEHAEIFYNHLSELAGETIHVDGGYPVDITDSITELLRMAQHNEYEEHDDVYRAFADKAREEGFLAVASSFEQIAKIEKIHGNRFGALADLLEKNQLFISDVKTGWFCLNCGHVFEGTQAPEHCPVCSHDRGYFVRLELAPYTGNCCVEGVLG